MELSIKANAVFKILLGCISVLLALNLLSIAKKFGLDSDYIYIVQFDFETSLPTLYSCLTLALTAGLLAIISLTQKAINKGHLLWMLLAAIFAFLCLDEFLSLHERLAEPMRNQFKAEGLLYYAWIIPYGILVLVLAACYSRFLFKLPARTALLFVIAGFLFISGAIGVEMLGGKHDEQFGNLNLTYAMYFTIEELLEMLGIALFIYALIDFMESQFGGVSISFSSPTKSPSIHN